ncbi:MAG: transcription initiation factor IIB, partial [Nitrososphaeraceae archaeon]
MVITDPDCGEIICSNCGMVLSDKIQESSRPEKRTFNSSDRDNRDRTGIPTSLARHDMGLATTIANTDRDASGHKIDATMRSTMNRLRVWHFRTQAYTPTDKNLLQAFNELDLLKDKLSLPDASVQKAAYIYRKVQEKGLGRRRPIHTVLAAVIYIACREMEIPRTIKDISTNSNIKPNEISRLYRLLVFELDIRIPLVDPMKCITMISNKVNVSEKIKHHAMNIMNDDITKSQISAGKNPLGLAASILYLSCLINNSSINQT